MPGSVTRSLTPCTPWRSTSSATPNASTIDVRWSSTASRRLFGTTISVSTSAPSASMPTSATDARRVPSKPNGLVMMPTVSAPISRRDARDDRSGAGAGAAAGAGGDEHHVRALEQVLDAVVVLHRRGAPELRVGAGAEAAREALADVDRDVGVRLLQRLHVGVDGDELDAGDAGLDHAVDGVDAGTADADDADQRRAGASTARSTGSRRTTAPGPRATAASERHVRRAARVEDVLRQVGAERAAQPLLRRRDAALGLGLRARRRRATGAGSRRARRAWRRRTARRPARARARPAARAAPWRAARAWPRPRGFGRGLLGAAEQLRQRALPHARAVALGASHRP